jgi:hypothetical protein
MPPLPDDSQKLVKGGNRGRLRYVLFIEQPHKALGFQEGGGAGSWRLGEGLSALDERSVAYLPSYLRSDIYFGDGG